MAMSHRPFSLFFAGKLRIAKYKQRRHKNLSESECMELIASASKRGKNVSQFIWNCYSFSLLDFWLVEKVAGGFFGVSQGSATLLPNQSDWTRCLSNSHQSWPITVRHAGQLNSRQIWPMNRRMTAGQMNCHKSDQSPYGKQINERC